jgi:hypothetical protein
MITYQALSDFIFADRRHLFSCPDLVIYHPGHYTECNNAIIKLYQEEGFAKITLSAAPNRFMDGQSEYDVHKPILIEGGIPEHDIIRISEGITIEEIVKHSFRIPQQQGFPIHKVLLVGKAFFARRLLLLGERYAPQGTVVDVLGLVDHRGITKDNWMNSPQGKQRVIGELEKIANMLGSSH